MIGIMKKCSSVAGVYGALVLAAGGIVASSASRIYAQPAPPDSNELEVIRLRSNFYVIAGGGANVSVQFGEDGVVLVDSGSAGSSAKMLAAIKKVTAETIRYVINTGPDADNVGGNGSLAKAGTALGGRSNTLGETGAAVLARLEVLNHVSAPTGKVAQFPLEVWPTETFFDKQKALYLNDEGIQVITLAPAHTDADSLVYFRRSDVIAAGNIIDTRHFPVIDLEKGGNIQGEIEALNRLVEMAIPSIPLVYKAGGTYVVPGHGHVLEQADVVDYRDMVTVIRDLVQRGIQKGMTLQQIQQMSPAAGYRIRYGSDTGPWTTNRFVEAIYKSLTAGK